MELCYQWETLSIYITCMPSPLRNSLVIKTSRRMLTLQGGTSLRVYRTMDRQIKLNPLRQRMLTLNDPPSLIHVHKYFHDSPDHS